MYGDQLGKNKVEIIKDSNDVDSVLGMNMNGISVIYENDDHDQIDDQENDNDSEGNSNSSDLYNNPEINPKETESEGIQLVRIDSTTLVGGNSHNSGEYHDWPTTCINDIDF